VALGLWEVQNLLFNWPADLEGVYEGRCLRLWLRRYWRTADLECRAMALHWLRKLPLDAAAALDRIAQGDELGPSRFDVRFPTQTGRSGRSF